MLAPTPHASAESFQHVPDFKLNSVVNKNHNLSSLTFPISFISINCILGKFYLAIEMIVPMSAPPYCLGMHQLVVASQGGGRGSISSERMCGFPHHLPSPPLHSLAFVLSFAGRV